MFCGLGDRGRVHVQPVLRVSYPPRGVGLSGKESTGGNTITHRHKGGLSSLEIGLTLDYVDRETFRYFQRARHKPPLRLCLDRTQKEVMYRGYSKLRTCTDPRVVLCS